MFPPAPAGHHAHRPGLLHLALNLTLFVLAVFWLGLAYWVYRDARRRSRDRLLVGAATLLGLVPVVGPLVYLLFRPPETLDEAKARRVEVGPSSRWLRRDAAALPHLPRRRRGRLPRLPGLHDPAEGAVRGLRGPARAPLARLPVLRAARRGAGGRSTSTPRYGRGRERGACVQGTAVARPQQARAAEPRAG